MLPVLRLRVIAYLTAAGLLYGISLPLSAQDVSAATTTTQPASLTPASVLMRDPMASYEINKHIFTAVKAAHGMVATESALDCRETAPAAARHDMYVDPKGNLLQGASLYAHLAVGVPNTPAGLLKALHAEADHLQRWPATRKIFFKPRAHCQSQPCTDDTPHVPLEAGDLLVQSNLANTLERIAHDGVRGFYESETAEKIAAEMKTYQGIVSLKDLSAYRSVERQPIIGTYRGYRVVSMPPPSSGGAHVGQILNILERYPLGAYGAGSAQAIHLTSEAMKLAFADRSQYMGDPDFANIALRGLTSRAYADYLAASIHSSCVIAGNAVSTTYTLNLNVGSGIVATGTGVLLNNDAGSAPTPCSALKAWATS